MVHLITGYAGYEHIQSEDDGSFNAAFFGDGQYIMEIGNQFAGSIIDNNTVRILDGDGLMYGRHFRVKPNVYEDLIIKTGTAGTNRIDLICLTYEKNADDETEKVYLQVLEGTETAGTPSAPAHTDGNILEGASFNQMPLYKVMIKGVVLSEIEAVFDTLPSYEGLARMYAERFEAACEEIKTSFSLDNILKRTDVVDNLLSSATDLPLSANMGKLLNSNMTLLWENPNPATGFNPQTVSISNLSKYKAVIVWIYSNESLLNLGSIVITKTTMNNKPIQFCVPLPDDTGNYIASRMITVDFSGNRVVFGEGKLGTSVLNARGVPFAVYGVY